MNPENIKNIIQTISETLTPLAEKIGKGGEYLFRLAVKQVYVDAVVSGIFFVIFCLLLIPYWKFVKWGLEKNSSDDERSRFYRREGVFVLAVILGTGLTFGLLISGITSIFSIPQAIFNPEYQAIKNILEMVK